MRPLIERNLCRMTSETRRLGLTIHFGPIVLA
ncbi:hypothetical protein FrEUN1fDRAFT_3381 [Parafrankia sp. EUN1f]|nr:hypothetical protein FrEUN1fDRAFT_3381 [Parafrankia sp. EUN1f]